MSRLVDLSLANSNNYKVAKALEAQIGAADQLIGVKTYMKTRYRILRNVEHKGRIKAWLLLPYYLFKYIIL